MILWLALATLIFAEPAFAAREDDKGCGTYPEEALRFTENFIDCTLQRSGETSLWRGRLPARVLQRVRFTYSSPFYNYLEVINFEAHADGSGTIRLKTLRRNSSKRWTISITKSRRVSPADVATIDRLGISSGNWEPAIGSWDSVEVDDNGNVKFRHHCPQLDMERLIPSGYSFSAVSLGCVEPTKLMPFVRFMRNLAGAKG